MRVASVVGARPNFIKLAPVARALASRRGVEHVVVHTGQHYDAGMSEIFFTDFGLGLPDYNLGVGSGSHAKQTAAILERLEPVCVTLQPDWVLVYGDVNSTVAGALAAVKLGIRVAHVEAGLRSGDRTMPEEHNRVATDHLADLLFAPSRDAVANLRREGIAEERIAFVGNTMIDTLVASLSAARELRAARRYGLPDGGYLVVTLHRPSNVDDDARLADLMRGLRAIAEQIPVLFPLHPRSRQRVEAAGLGRQSGRVRCVNPLSYIEMLSLVDTAMVVATDSGGLQEETTFLGVPCLTLRPNTERPVTVSVGTNRLIKGGGDDLAAAALDGQLARRPSIIERWDGHSAERIVAVLCDGERFD